MPAGRETERGVLGEQTLVWGEAAESEQLVRMVQSQLELPATAAVDRA